MVLAANLAVFCLDLCFSVHLAGVSSSSGKSNYILGTILAVLVRF